MFARLAFTTAALVAVSVVPASADPRAILLFAIKCLTSDAVVTQCEYQTVKGDRNIAIIKQKVVYSGDGDDRLRQLGVNYQDGDDNVAYIEQHSSSDGNQIAFSAQIGNDNKAFTYQEGVAQGSDQFSGTVQVGTGHWAATSSIGDNTETFVYQEN